MNVMMTGRRRCALALLLAALVLSGCGKKDAPDAPEQTAQTAAYSNLSDEASKELLSELFADAGIAAERADKFFACLDQFNGSVKAEWLTDGFETAAPTETKYDPYEMQEMWMERQGDFPGYNCRITAYELMGDRITAGEDQPDTNGEDWLFMDLETLKRDPDALCGKSTADFCALFAPVEAADSTDSSVQAETLRKGWAARGVTFSERRVQHDLRRLPRPFFRNGEYALHRTRRRAPSRRGRWALFCRKGRLSGAVPPDEV